MENISFTFRLAAREDNEKIQVSVGQFQEPHPVENKIFVFNHFNDLVWVFGKMYRRSFLEKYNIRFHPTSRANEDNGFNTLCRLYSNENEQIFMFEDLVYYWHPTEDSITRRNNEEYAKSSAKDANFYGYVENMIYAITIAYNDPKIEDKTNIIAWSMEVMVGLYYLYLVVLNTSTEQQCAECLEYCKWYNNEIFSIFRPIVSDEHFLAIYNEVAISQQQRPGWCLIPSLTFFQFLDLIKTDDESVDNCDLNNEENIDENNNEG